MEGNLTLLPWGCRPVPHLTTWRPRDRECVNKPPPPPAQLEREPPLVSEQGQGAA